MKKRYESALLAAALLVLGGACRESKPSEASAIDAGAPTAVPFAATIPEGTPSAVAASAPEDESPAADAGLDAGVRKRRRLLAGGDGGAVVAPASSLETAPPAVEPSRNPKRAKSAGPMGDDLPYGGAAASGAPFLKKAPLTNDDPWAKDAAR